MAEPLRVAGVRLTAASPEGLRTGLIGHVRFVVNEALVVDGVALRRTLDGRLVLSFPARADSKGRRRFSVRPLDDRSRIALEAQVCSALGIKSDESAP